MGSDWQTIRLGDYADSCLGKMLDKEKNRGALYPYLGNKKVRWGSFHLDDLAQMRFEDHEHERYGLKHGDLVVCEGGEPGRCAIWKDQVRGMKIQKALHRIRPHKGLNNVYLHYWFFWAGKTGALEQHFTGTTIKHLTGKAIAELPIPLPPLDKQKAIAHILGTLDDKIELNRQMNTTLEAMAQALFKSWFVDFDPVIDNALAAGNPIPKPLQARAANRQALGEQRKPLPETILQQFPNRFEFTEEMGWIPQGWECAKLNELLEVKYGKDHKKLNEGSIPVYGSGGLMRWVDQSLYKGESILIPRKGTLKNLMYVDEEFWTVDTMFYSIPKLKPSAIYLFHSLSTFDFTAMNVGSAVPSMTTKVLNDLNILKPTETILSSFEAYVSDYYGKKRNVKNEVHALIELRDTLLPKLLSGELRIPDAEKIVANAL